MTHKGHEYLIICNSFSKYPSTYKVSTKSAQFLCTHLHELISQYGPPSLLSSDNRPPSASDELMEFLMHYCIEHHTSSPHFPRSNGFIERQVRTIKTALNTALPSKKFFETVLPDLWSTPMGPNMPSPYEILHNRTIQCSGRPSQPVDMEKIRNFLLSRKQAQCDQFNKSHWSHALPELPPGQEVLFRSPLDDDYISGTIIKKATAPHSYIIEAQGKRYCKTREHVLPIHINISPPIHQQQNPHSKLCISGPSPPISHIPRPNHSIPSLSTPSGLQRSPLPHPTLQSPSCIPCLAHTNKAGTACPKTEDLNLHLSTITPSPVLVCNQRNLRHPQHLNQHQPHLTSLRRSWKLRPPSPPDSQASTASYSLHPRLPIRYNETALSHLEGRPQVRICITYPFPSPGTVSALLQMTYLQMVTCPQMTLQKLWQMHQTTRQNHQQQPEAWTHLPSPQEVQMTSNRSDRP